MQGSRLRKGKIVVTDFTQSDDPLGLFNEWLNEAKDSEINDHNAMALATVDQTGMPNVRMVLLKGHDERGFVFYTNFESTKGQGSAQLHEGLHGIPLEKPAEAGARARQTGTSLGTGGGRLF